MNFYCYSSISTAMYYLCDHKDNSKVYHKENFIDSCLPLNRALKLNHILCSIFSKDEVSYCFTNVLIDYRNFILNLSDVLYGSGYHFNWVCLYFVSPSIYLWAFVLGNDFAFCIGLSSFRMHCCKSYYSCLELQI